MECRRLECSSWSSLGCNRNGCRVHSYPSPTTSNHPSPFDATSAQCHKTYLMKYGVMIGCSACSDIAVHGNPAEPQTEECRKRIGVQWSTILEVTNVCKFTDADETWNLRLERTGTSLKKMRVIPYTQAVEMPVAAVVESASVKRGSDAVADNEERTEEARNTICKTYWNPRHATSPRSGGRGHVDSSCRVALLWYSWIPLL